MHSLADAILFVYSHSGTGHLLAAVEDVLQMRPFWTRHMAVRRAGQISAHHCMSQAAPIAFHACNVLF